MLKLINVRALIKGHELNTIVLFLEPVFMVNGKDVKIIPYPYMSRQAWQDQPQVNHFRHETKLLGTFTETQLLPVEIKKGEKVMQGDIIITGASVLVDDEVVAIPDNSAIENEFTTESDCSVSRPTEVEVQRFVDLEDIIVKTAGHIQEPLSYEDIKIKVVEFLTTNRICTLSDISEV